MFKKIFLPVLFFSSFIFGQDIIKFNDGTELNTKILTNSAKTISYKYHKKKPAIFIVKNEIQQIVFEDGTVENINHSELTLEEIKHNVVALVKECALTEKASKNFTARFEGDFLRMIALGKKDNRELNKGLLFDFSRVYEFHKLSLRKKNNSYINIWLDRIRWADREGEDKFDKIKLIIRSNSYEKGALLLNAFKQLHEALPKS